ncbi:MAG: HAMP domain-containing histidine kinase [Gemmatimonadota bacterium]|nr:HAMP domain-containing histidine kinase [Gemmatimonadota bacterium]
MSDLPAPVLSFLQAEVLRERAPAFLLLDDDARLVDWGGPLDTYGIVGLERGTPAAEQVPFLLGLVPTTAPQELPRVEPTGGNAADVHTFRSDAGTWVVLRNATWTVQHERELQQSRNALTLLEERNKRDGAATLATGRVIAAEVLGALGVAVLEYRSADGFRLIGTPPVWFFALWPEAMESPDDVRLEVPSPFLANFLLDAHESWKLGCDQRSGIWTEVDGAGREWQLEATARSIGGRQLLTIAEVGTRVLEKQDLLQRAREHALGHQRLLKDIEKKDVLLHWIVHDLRTPMVSAHAALQLLATEDLPEQAQRTLAVGRTELERQDLLIRSILDVFAADLHALDTLAADAPPADVLECGREVVNGFAPAFGLREVKLTVDAPGAPAGTWSVHADESRLARVFANLLDNALRHSKPATRVRVAFSRESDTVVVRVEDQGAGVSEEFVPHLFDRFSKAGREGKTGLGLHYCRITIESWGGRIGYEPCRGGGSCFWFRIPAERTRD